MFNSLTNKFTTIFRNLGGYGKLTDENVQEALAAVRLALLEADVHFKVVKSFVSRVKEQAMGLQVHPGLNPGQQFIQVVHQELVRLMGQEAQGLSFTGQPPMIVMMVGLQGSGKTTTVGKLARHLKEQNRKPMLVAGDIYRPAAIDQLETIGQQLGVEVYSDRSGKDPVGIANDALALSYRKDCDVLICDTAGRLHIDEEMMVEVARIRDSISPHEVLLVVDAMTGQDAVRVAEEFNQRVAITGVILSKLDGDARGGAALSIREVTGKPIKFVGVGEKLDALQPFHPDRMAQRILGMGDVLSLIEKVQTSFDEQGMRQMESRMLSDDFNLEDFLNQFQQVKKLGPLKEILKMIPGLSALTGGQEVDIDPKQLSHAEAIISSMTVKERKKPQIIDGARRKRIAKGSGTSVQDVNQLMKQFQQTKQMMKQFSSMSKAAKKGKGRMRFPFFGR
ncbi:MAG: signal recognition particle protein [Candidatus Riflebacteria bacterium]|nr:signal recognition particle protein [Candidatus Riflebacteria bacterium]